MASCGAPAQFGGAASQAVRRLRAATPPQFPTADSFGHGFNFCRGIYTSTRREAGGQGWCTDYPDADLNFSIRLVGADAGRASACDARRHGRTTSSSGSPTTRCSSARSPHGGRRHRDVQRARGRRRCATYLLKGGFLWVDDFWGTYAWDAVGVARSRACCRRRSIRSSDIPLGSSAVEGAVRRSRSFRRSRRSSAWRGNPQRDVRARLRQRRAALPRHLRPPRQHHGADDAQHRHLRCVGARRRGSAVLLPVLAEGLRGRHQRDACTR